MYDVIIIGAGGAGLSAALECKKLKLKVLLVNKTYPTQSQTVQAQGGINAVIYENGYDNKNNHIEDTYISSKKISSKNRIKDMCNSGHEVITWLDKLGVPFSKDDKGTIRQRPFGGTKYLRTCYSSDYTGLKILHTLYDNCIKENIEFLNEHQLIDLLKEKELINGVQVIDIQKGIIKNIYSKSVILASGGFSNLYLETTNSNSTTGEAISIAYENGAKLSNLEFVQFHPTSLNSSNTLISETARAEGAYLINSDNERFVDELKTRDVVARAIASEINNGKKVYLDFRHLDENKLKITMPQEIKLINDLLNLNIKNDLIPITPAAHYTMGGIFTNVSHETSIENLYAIGECAQNNIHGANRLGGNSLLEIITSGKSCASKIEKKISSKNYKIKDFDEKKKEIQSLIKKDGHKDLYKIKKLMKKEVSSKIGLFREKSKMKNSLKKLRELKEDYKECKIEDKSLIYNKNLLDYIELSHQLNLSELLIISALKREESRGSHYRIDYKEEKKEYEKISIIEKIDGQIKHTFKAIDEN